MLQSRDLCIEELHHEGEREISVFDACDGDGFTTDGWEDTDFDNIRRFRFAFRDEEAGRADVVADATGGDEYCGPHSGKAVPRIWFIEVRESLQRTNLRVGHAIVQALVELHGGTMCAVSIPGAREFWMSIGWIEYPDREVPAANSNLFVSCANAVRIERPIDGAFGMALLGTLVSP